MSWQIEHAWQETEPSGRRPYRRKGNRAQEFQRVPPTRDPFTVTAAEVHVLLARWRRV